MGKRFVVFVFLLVLVLPFHTVSVSGLIFEESPKPDESPEVVITSIVGNGLAGGVAMAEMFNNSGRPINGSGWKVEFSLDGCESVSQVFPNKWFLPKKYLTLTADITQPGCADAKLLSVKLSDGSGLVQKVDVTYTGESGKDLSIDKIAQHRQRGNSINSTRSVSGNFAEDYKIVSPTTLYSDPLYLPPEDNDGLQILEILPNARECSPLDTDVTCGDYVKLHNSTSHDIDLSAYRLRAGHAGQGESITNTFTWGQEIDPANDELILPPGKYLTLSVRNDGDVLSLTDSGGHVWLEDAYGVEIYEPVIEYPSASSSSKTGLAWAYDGKTWRWTSTPRPGEANHFPADMPDVTTVASNALAPCPKGKFRNPETNRCKNIVLASSSLKPCKPGQVRNPETNRCRSTVSTSSSLVPCKPGQTRNPETNRCRSTLSAQSTLKPCEEGEERNPETNRCRTKATLASAAGNLPKGDSEKRKTNFLIVGAVAAVAVGYGAFEYRRDIQSTLLGLKSRFFAKPGK